MWYRDPLDWIKEVEEQDGEFCWIHHFIAEHEGQPVGFCQYYACKGCVHIEATCDELPAPRPKKKK